MVQNRYSIKFTPRASEDLNMIYDYIATDVLNTNAAEDLMDKIEDSIMRLKDFPLSCNLVAGEILKDKGYRRLVVDNYIVFYIVDEVQRSVVIMRVLYGRRKYQGII